MCESLQMLAEAGLLAERLRSAENILFLPEVRGSLLSGVLFQLMAQTQQAITGNSTSELSSSGIGSFG